MSRGGQEHSGGHKEPGRQPRSRSRPLPIAVYLFALILVILIPALIVSLVLLNGNNRAQEEIVQGLTNATVQAIGQSVEREVAGMMTTLRILSTSDSLAEANFRQFHNRAVVALARPATARALPESHQTL